MMRNGPLALLFNALFLTFMIAPLAVIVWMSFTPSGLLELPTTSFSLRWYVAIVEDGRFLPALWLSAKLALVSATIAVLLAVPAAYSLARHVFPGRAALVGIFMSPLIIPHVVLGVSFLKFFSEAGLNGSALGLIGAHLVVIFPYALRLTLAGFTAYDVSIERAAVSLGASRWIVFKSVVVPVLIPALAGAWAISFIQSFDEVTMTAFLTTPSLTTLPVKLYHYVEESIDPLVTSVSTMVIVLTYVVMFALDRIYGLDKLLVGHR